MAYVTPREGEGAESLVNRFRASVQHSGILRELKDRRFFRSRLRRNGWPRSERPGVVVARAAATASLQEFEPCLSERRMASATRHVSLLTGFTGVRQRAAAL